MSVVNSLTIVVSDVSSEIVTKPISCKSEEDDCSDYGKTELYIQQANGKQGKSVLFFFYWEDEPKGRISEFRKSTEIFRAIYYPRKAELKNWETYRYAQQLVEQNPHLKERSIYIEGLE